MINNQSTMWLINKLFEGKLFVCELYFCFISSFVIGFFAVNIKWKQQPKDVCRIGIFWIKSTKNNGTTPVKELG